MAKLRVNCFGGTIFHFVTDGIEVALRRAKDAANGKDVRLGGGVATIQQYLRAGLVDELHVAISPVLLGSGEQLFRDIELKSLGYRCVEHVASPKATHVCLGSSVTGIACAALTTNMRRTRPRDQQDSRARNSTRGD